MELAIGIDTSCYTTSVAAMDGAGRILADVRIPLQVKPGGKGLAQSEMVFQHVRNLPVVMERCDFEQVYSDNWWKKLKDGTSVYGVFWDKDMENGLGDISVQKVDLLNLFWEPGIGDIQRSRNVFLFVNRPSGNGPLQSSVQQVEEMVTEVLRMEAPDADPERVSLWAAGTVGLVRAAAEHWADGPPEERTELDQLADDLTTMLWRGLHALASPTD